MSTQVSKSRFRAKALELFRQVGSSGEAVVVTDRGEPKLEVRRYQAPSRDPLAALRGSVLRSDVLIWRESDLAPQTRA